MPCRCCGSLGRPTQGFNRPIESQINAHLAAAAKLIRKECCDYEDIDQWKAGWIEAFTHHINGCAEKYQEKK